MEDRMAKNIEISLQKKQTNKCKAVLSNNYIAKKSNER